MRDWSALVRPHLASLRVDERRRLEIGAELGLTAAAVVLPISNTYERRGSFTNFAGKCNTFEQVFDKPPQVQHAVDVFRSLAS